MQRITAKQIKELREQYLQIQNNLCALCQDYLDPAESVLDHDHASGQLRGTLHRGCNAFLGHIENNMKRNRIDDVRLAAILANLQHYQRQLKDVLHPTHLTPEEKKQRATRRAKKRRQAKKK